MTIDSFWQPAGITLILIMLAEMGDKSQLVCMILAARHKRARPVLGGAIAAFALLNAAAVIFGATLAAWLPPIWVLAAMATLFAAFGIHALRQSGADDENEDQAEISGHSLFITTFLMIFIAEFGDKTQIAVVGLAGLHPASAVWLGATAALALTSGIGIIAGKTLLQRLPMVWLHRLSGLFFLALSGAAIWQVLEII